ncbi:MAG: hypothetical protein ACO1QR_16925 [Chthoniobacteraceae bacterium]
MSTLKVYDKAKYHDETVAEHGLTESHASHHILFFFRWLLEHDLLSKELQMDFPEEYEAARSGRISALRYFNILDRCLISDMLSKEGNAFAGAYFDYERGCYLSDLVDTLQGGLPSEFHISFTEDTYRKFKCVIDRRFAAWKAGDVTNIAQT